MLSQTTTHISLLARLSDGADRGAWVEFVDRYSDLIRGFARKQGLQPAECDDVLQDVLISLTQSMPGFRYDPAKGKFRSYLKTIVLHAVYRRSCQKSPAGALDGIVMSPAKSSDDAIETEWETEWRQYHLKMAMRIVNAEFNQADRQAFERYALAGDDARLTAEALRMSVDQVYQAKSRILRRLGELIDQQVQDEG